VAHTICRAPAPVMWNFPTNEKANDYAKRRAVPFRRGVRGVPEPEGRHDATRMELVLPTMWLYGWDDVRAKQLEYGVPGVCVCVDCGEGRSANEVYFQCVRHGHADVVAACMAGIIGEKIG
jgi:hypothetical protein